MIPDIVIYSGNKIKAILDVKYKMPDSKDFYQIYSYMKYTKSQIAYIISPAVENNKTITAFDGSKIYFIRIDNSDCLYLENSVNEIIQMIMKNQK